MRLAQLRTKGVAVAKLATMAMLVSSVPAMGDGRFDCSTLVPISVRFEPGDANQACGSLTAPQCLSVTNGILSAKNEIDKAHEALCGTVNQVDSEAANAALSGQQKTAYEQQIKIYNGAATAYGDYQKVLIKESLDVGNLVLSKQGPLNPVLDEHNNQEKQNIAQALHDKSPSLSSLNALPDHPMKSIENPATEEGTIYAARNGVSFLKAIVRQVNDTKGKIASLNVDQSQLAAKSEDLSNGDKEKKDPSTVTGDKKDDGSGLDLKSLAGLASAGAGLAGLMSKSSASSAADTSTNTSSQMSGEPGGQQQQQTSKLGDSKADSTTAPVDMKVKQPAPDAPSARSPASPSSEPFDSNISRNTPSTNAPATTPATAKATGGGSMGGAKPSDKPEDPAAKQPLTATGQPPDDSQGMGGGGGPSGGGGGAPSLASNPGDKPPGGDAAPAPEAAMNDLLHEMKETVDNANGGAQGSAEIVMGDEDLFPRVRSCYTRLMKSGRVLDGLNEKISPESP